MSVSNSTVINVQADIDGAKAKLKELQKSAENSLGAIAESSKKVTEATKKQEEEQKKLAKLQKKQTQEKTAFINAQNIVAEKEIELLKKKNELSSLTSNKKYNKDSKARIEDNIKELEKELSVYKTRADVYKKDKQILDRKVSLQKTITADAKREVNTLTDKLKKEEDGIKRIQSGIKDEQKSLEKLEKTKDTIRKKESKAYKEKLLQNIKISQEIRESIKERKKQFFIEQQRTKELIQQSQLEKQLSTQRQSASKLLVPKSETETYQSVAKNSFENYGKIKGRWDTSDMNKYYSELDKKSKIAQKEIDKNREAERVSTKQRILDNIKISQGIRESIKETRKQFYIKKQILDNSKLQLNLDSKILTKEEEKLSKMTEAEKKQHKMNLLIEKERNIAKENILSMSREGKAKQELINKQRKLNSALEAGVISQHEYNLVNRQLNNDLREQVATRNSLTNSIVRHLRQLETAIFATFMLSRAYQTTVGKGVELNTTLENNAYGLAALIASNTKLVNSQGKVLKSGDKFNSALKLSQKTMLDLKKASAETSATFPELTSVFQQAIGYSLKMGSSFASSTEQAITRTIEITKNLTNMGGAIGMMPQLIEEESRSLFSGDVSRDSKLAILLFGSPTAANKAMKDAKTGVGKYANDVFGLLSDKLKEFEQLSSIDTLQRNMDKTRAEWETLMMDLSEPVFEDFKIALKELRVLMKENGKDLAIMFKDAYEKGKELAPILLQIAQAFIVFKAGSYIHTGLANILSKSRSIGDSFTELLRGTNKVSKAMRLLGSPLVMGAVALVGYEIYKYIKDSAEKAEALNKAMALTSEEIKKQSKYKTDYSLFILEEKLRKQEKLMQDAKADSRNQGIFESDEEHKKDLAYTIEMRENFEKLRKEVIRYKNIINEKTKVDGVLSGRLEALKQYGEISELIKKLKNEADESNGDNKYKRERTKAKQQYESDVKEIEDISLDRIKIYNDWLNKKSGLSKQEIKIAEETNVAMIEAKRKYQGELKKINKDEEKAEETKRKNILRKKEQEIKANIRLLKTKIDISNLKIGNKSSDITEVDLLKSKVVSYKKLYDFATKNNYSEQQTSDILKIILETEKKITEEKEKQSNKKATSIIKDFKRNAKKTNSLSGIDDLAIESELDLFDADASKEKLKEFYDSFADIRDKLISDAKDIKKFFNFEVSIDDRAFGKYAKSINEIEKVKKSIAKEQKLYNKGIIESKNLGKDTAKLEAKHFQNQLVGYSNMAGAMSDMFKQGSKESEAFRLAQLALASINAVNAVLTQGMGDPYTAIPRMIYMAASVSALLSQIGVTFGSTKVTTTNDAFSAQIENTGTGTTLGDSEAESESIVNSLSILEDYAQPQFKVLSEMNRSLKTLNERIGGLSSLLIRDGNYGDGFTPYDSGFRNNVSLGSSGGTLGVLGGAALGGTGVGLALLGIDKLILGGALSKLVNNVFGSILGGLFGKTSVSRSLQDYGIKFNNVLLESAMESISGNSYQVVKTVTKKKSWFHSSESTSYSTYFKDLNDDLEKQFSLALSNLYDSTLASGDALDTSVEYVQNSLKDFVVKIGKISTKGKSGDALKEQITNIFGAIGDDIAKTAYPELQSFQQIGEGLFETMTRVSTGMEVAEYYISRLGNQFNDLKYTDIINTQGDVGVQALTQSIEKFDEAVYGANNGVVQMIDTFSGTTEDLYNMYTVFQSLRIQLDSINKGAKNLTASMILGAGSIDGLSKGINDYFDGFLSAEEQLSSQTIMMTAEFDKLGLSLPNGINGFKHLIDGLDTSTEAGQELFGRLILLSDGFKKMNDNSSDLLDAEVSNELELARLKDKINEEQLSSYKTVLNAVKELNNSFEKMVDSINDKIVSLLGNDTSYDSQSYLISKFWDTKEEIDNLLNYNGDLTNAQSSRLSSLVSDINSLSSSIQSGAGADNSETTQNLVSELDNINNRLELNSDTLNVKIEDAQWLDIKSLSIGGVKATVAVGDDGELLTSLVDKNFNISIDSEYESIVSSLIDAGYKWNDDKDSLSTASTLASAGYRWDADGNLASAQDMKTANYLWNQDGLKEAVNTVSVRDGKLQFDWNNDSVIDASAIIGEDGTLTSIKENTGNDGDTTVGVLTQLKESIDAYNSTIKDSLKIDETPLNLDDFKAGGLLNTQDEISFRQSFTADSAETFNDELESLRTSLSYLSLDTTNTEDYVKKLYELNDSGYNNLKEFLSYTDSNPKGINSIFRDIQISEVEKGLNTIASLGELTKDEVGRLINSGLISKREAYDNYNYYTDTEAYAEGILSDFETYALDVVKITRNTDLNDSIEKLANIDNNTLLNKIQDYQSNNIGDILSLLDTYSSKEIISKLSDKIEEEVNMSILGDNDFSDGQFISLAPDLNARTAANVTNANDAFGLIQQKISDLGLYQYILNYIYHDYNDNDGKNVKQIKDALNGVLDDSRKVLTPKKINSYDVGTSYVSHDQTANIHKGEIIIDPQSSNVLRKYGIAVNNTQSTANSGLIEEVRNLRKTTEEQNKIITELLKDSRKSTREQQRSFRTDKVSTLQGAVG